MSERAGVKIEKMGDWYYLRYAEVAVRWDVLSSWFLTVDESVSHKSSGAFEGLCGNYNGDPYGMKLHVNTANCLCMTALHRHFSV